MKSAVTIIFVVSFASGCAGTPNVSGCDVDASTRFFDSDPESLVLHVASPIYSDSKNPYLSLGPVGTHPGLRVDLQPVILSEFDGVDKTACRTTEIRSFHLVTSESEWIPYWEESRSVRKFSAGIGLPGMTKTTHAEEFGFAAVNQESGAVEFACGCIRGR